jgi:ribonuclease D
VLLKPREKDLQSALGSVALATDDARLARMKDLRRDMVRSLGTMFFQYLPDDLLRRLIANPPKSVEELRDDFELHHKIVECVGARIVQVAGAQIAEPARPVPEPRDRASRAKVAAAKEIAGGKVSVLHGRAVEQRFERLRTLRLELARKRGWRAFQILHDATLLDIARVRPRTMRELMEIKGIGKKKAEEFGKELLAEAAKD